jgi:outer membrane receptor protein involved in Fe transport
MLGHRRHTLLEATALATAALSTPALAQAKHFDIPALPVATAINALAKQGDIQIIAPQKATKGIRGNRVQGDMSAHEALRALLAGTGLTYHKSDERTFVIESSSRGNALAGGPNAGTDGESSKQIVVTGSRIRGASPTSPVRIVGAQEIARSGYVETGDFIRSLPENFAGGENPGNIGVSFANANQANASTVNLRGLGDGATLVLVNGRRIAGNVSNQSGDISGIPISAISRIEILTGGSSAIYGSDAVAGVVNFITRRDFNGLELNANLGGATRGGAFEQTYSALGGVSRSGWHALANVERSVQEGLEARQRDITAGAIPDLYLLRPQHRTSAYLNAGADITDRLSASAQVLWSERSTKDVQQLSTSSARFVLDTHTSSHLASGALHYRISDDWTVELDASNAASRTHYVQVTPGSTYDQHFDNATNSVEATVTGALAALPSGKLEMAFGGGWRDESYKRTGVFSGGTDSHDIGYAFGELRLPLVPPSRDRAGLNAFEVSASGRYEHYADFGSTAIPKLGLRYVPFAALTVRATWGKSFKAPTFQQLVQPTTLGIYPASLIGGSSGNAIYIGGGGSADLRPERSKSWTLGADFAPPTIPSLHLGLSYFNIAYKDRVVIPISAPTTALSNPIFAPYVDFNPSAEEQAAAIASADRVNNFTGAPYDPATVVALVANVWTNAVAQKVRGVDFSYRQDFDLAGGRLSAFANATRIQIDQQALPTLPPTRLSGTVGNIPQFRARGGLTWSSGGFSGTAIVNHHDGAIDTGVTPNRPVASLTTFDASLRYRFDTARLELSVAATNLFDADPPFAASPGIFQPGINYDSVNSSPLGRIVRVGLRKWF